MSIWAAVDRVVDRATDPAALLAHGLHLWAGRRWQATGRPIPPEFLDHERAAAMAVLSVPSLLMWIRTVLDGPVLLLKGPEVASRYPDSALRPFGDLDLLVPQAEDAQRMLVAAGCVEVEEALPNHHHRPALRYLDSLLLIEIHDKPSGPRWTTVSTDELFASAIPSSVGVDGILTVPPAQHAVLLAAHSWHHEPFRRLIDLVDIAAMTDGLDPVELQQLANRWSLGQVWLATSRSIHALHTGIPPQKWSERLLGRHLWTVQERTIIEWRFARWAGSLWAPTCRAAISAIIWSLLEDAQPAADESWSRRLSRVPGALWRSLKPISERR